MSATIAIEGNAALVRFDRFGLDDYELFLRAKKLPEHRCTYDWATDTYTVATAARFAHLLGVLGEVAPVERPDLAPHLFDYQRFACERALAARRFALWLDTGLGKTACGLEWTRQACAATGGRVLWLAPTNDLIAQHVAAARAFYPDGAVPMEALPTRAALEAWCDLPGPGVGIATYAKFVPGAIPGLAYKLGGLVADEASMLKASGGVTKWNVLHSVKGIEYKLAMTATPAPNEVMEYASQANFCEQIRGQGDTFWSYFSRDKRGNWYVKPYAREAFYRYMASWSLYMRNPANFGFADILASLPAPDLREYQLAMTPTQRELMQGFMVRANRGFLVDDRLGIQERSKLSQLAKGFLYDKGEGAAGRHTALVPSPKPAFVADLARQDVRDGRQVLIWTVFDAESELIAEQLADVPGVAVLHGKLSDAERAQALDRFRDGDAPILISKASLIGFGLNFQFCRSMIFSGFDDSFERMYQAIRRCYRFGQTASVRVHVPYIPELEGLMLANVKEKERQFALDVAIQERHYRDAIESEAA